MSQTKTGIEKAKESAAFKAVDAHVKNGYKVGIGSGTTIPYALKRIRQNNLDVSCVPIAFQSKQLIRENGLRLTDLEESPELDVTIDGFDEVDVHTRTLILGACGAVTQVKIVANASKQVVIIGDKSKESEKLGQKWTKGIPIEVIPMAYKSVSNQIERQFKGKAVLRMAVAKAGPLVTDNNNFIIDWQFNSQDIKPFEWKDIYTTIKCTAGVVEVGLWFAEDRDLYVYMGSEDGTVKEV